MELNIPGLCILFKYVTEKIDWVFVKSNFHGAMTLNHNGIQHYDCQHEGLIALQLSA
jgi:hypothetical protein